MLRRWPLEALGPPTTRRTPPGAHLAGKLRQDEGRPVHVRVVVSQLHLFHLLLRQRLHRLLEVGVLGAGRGGEGRVKGGLSVPTGPCQPRTAGRTARKDSRKLTGFLLQSMKPIWPLG